MNEQMNWQVCSFQELDLDTFHDLLKLRIDVFVIEQDCPYDELDDQDRGTMHVIGRDALGTIKAYARILEANEKRPPAIGRVVIAKTARGLGLGHELIKVCLAWLQANRGSTHSFLSAQEHLQGYYGKHGYIKVSDAYDLDGIPHVDMLLMPSGSN